MPKAATVKHSRFLFAMYALYAGLVLGPEVVLQKVPSEGS